MNDRKLLLYISMSLDGYLAGPEDDLSWLDPFGSEEVDYGYYDFISQVDTYIVGRRTYDVVMGLVGEFAQADQFYCYVLTRHEIENTSNITFYKGDVQELINEIRKREGKHIYCDGGAQVVKLLLEEGLIDEMTISVIPVLLGGGTRLFLDGIRRGKLEKVGVKEYDDGVVQLKYKVIPLTQ